MVGSHASYLRERIAGEVEAGRSCRAAARRFGVRASTSVRIAKHKELVGSLERARIGQPAGSGQLSV